ncbi:MAG: hypothetical protein OXH20_00385 [bacterium]|nr:hypothetical protein [bacterium]MDE0669958.1 hypothetical protein [bacterium]
MSDNIVGIEVLTVTDPRWVAHVTDLLAGSVPDRVGGVVGRGDSFARRGGVVRPVAAGVIERLDQHAVLGGGAVAD